jgi:hypothetical protein
MSEKNLAPKATNSSEADESLKRLIDEARSSQKEAQPPAAENAKAEESNDFDDEVPTVIDRDPKAELDATRKHLAAKQADLRKYQGLVGKLRTKLTGAAEQKSAIEEEVEKVNAKYRELRAEVIGDDVMNMLDETEQSTKAYTEAVAEKKGWVGKKLETIRKVHKQLGDWNLEKLGWHPEGRIGKMVAKGVNVRQAINVALIGGGVALGGSSVGAYGLVAARRLLGGSTAGYGSYDFMSSLVDKKVKKETLKGLESDTNEGLIKRLEYIEAHARVDSQDLSQNEAYQKLKAEFGKRCGGQAIGSEGAPFQLDPEAMAELMKAKDEGVAELQNRFDKVKTATKVAATSFGILAGSGLIAKGIAKGAKGAWHLTFGSAQPAEAAAVLVDGNVVLDSPDLHDLAPRVEDVDPSATLHPEVSEVVPADSVQPTVEGAVPVDVAHPSVEGAAQIVPEAPPGH